MPLPSDDVSPEHRVVSRAVARRFLVLRHLLAPPRSLPAEPASVMRVVDRLGSLQFDPSTSRDATTTSRCSRGSRATGGPGPTTCCMPTGRCTRRTTRCCRWCPRPSCRGTGSPGTAITYAHGWGLRRACAAGRGAARANPRERAAVVDRHRAAGRDRLVLATDEPGPGPARGDGRGRDPLDRASRGQPPHLRPHRAAVPRRAAGPAGADRRAAAAQAPVPLPGQRPARGDRGVHALDGHRARPPSASRCCAS